MVVLLYSLYFPVIQMFLAISSWFSWMLMSVFVIRSQVVSAEVDLIQPMSSLANNGGRKHATALLLALQDGPAGAEHLQEWVAFLQSSTAELPPVWVVSRENTRTTALVRDLPLKFQPFIVEDNLPWETVLKNFALQVRNNGKSFHKSSRCSLCTN